MIDNLNKIRIIGSGICKSRCFGVYYAFARQNNRKPTFEEFHARAIKVYGDNEKKIRKRHNQRKQTKGYQKNIYKYITYLLEKNSQ